MRPKPREKQNPPKTQNQSRQSRFIAQLESHSAIDYVVALEDGETRVLTEEEERELGDIAAAKSLMK
jgi:hypothetical protein